MPPRPKRRVACKSSNQSLCALLTCLLATNISKPPPTLPVAKATKGKGKGAAKKNALLVLPVPAAPPSSPAPPIPSTLPVPTARPLKGRSLKNTHHDEDDNDNEDDDDGDDDDDDDDSEVRMAGVGISQPRAEAKELWALGYQVRDDDVNSDDEDEEDEDEDAVFKGRLYILTARNPLTRNPDISTYSYIDPDGHTVLMPRALHGMSVFLY
jgi:hypothetical protein